MSTQSTPQDLCNDVWVATVEDLAWRGVALEDILSFAITLLSDTDWFHPAQSLTRDVVFSAVIPATKSEGCSYATYVNGSAGKRARVFVTHLWDNVFLHTIAALVADTLDLPSYHDAVQRLSTLQGAAQLLVDLREARQAEKVYWLCALSVNQHKSVCNQPHHDSITGAPCPKCTCSLEKCTKGEASEMNKFADLMASLHLGDEGLTHLVAVDLDFRVFTRAWCVAELVEAHHQQMHQHLKLCTASSLETHRHKLKKLSVRDCEASDPQDTVTILESIGDIDSFDAHLRELLLNHRTGLLAAWQQTMSRYVLQWDHFSPAFMEKLERESAAARGWELLVAAFLPVTVAAPFFTLVPLPEPDGGQEEALLTLYLWVPPIMLPVFVGLQLVIFALARIDMDQVYAMRRWGLLVVSTSLQPVWNHFLWSFLQVWPMPWICGLSLPMACSSLSMTWFCLHQELRQSSAWRRRLFVSIAATLLLLVVWAMTAPLVAAQLSVSNSFWVHALLLAGLLGQKLLCERAVKCLEADVLPVFVWCSTGCYELLLCVALCRGNSWFLFGGLVGFDLAENCFHLWSLSKQHKQGDHVALGKEQAILAQLLLREFLELTAPLVFLVMLVSLWFGRQRRHSDLVCSWDDATFATACLMVLLDLVAELLIAGATWLTLWRQGKQPLRLLAGLVRQHLWVGVWFSYINVLCRYIEQSRFGGSDYRFEFLWMMREDAVWVCGLNWTAAEL